MVTEMRDLLTTSIESPDGDQQLRELLHASIESNVSTIFHMLQNDIDLQSLKPSTAAIEYAVRLAQRDIPLSALTRAYYLAQSLFLRVALEEVETLDLPDGARLELVRNIANGIHAYIDWMLQRVTEEHGTEHRRWWSARAMTNTAVILKVLRGETVTPQSFAAETLYDLERRHLSMVAWFEDPAGGVEAQQRLDRLVRQVAAMIGSTRAPLISAIDRTTAWRVALAAHRYRAAPVIADADPYVALTSILLKGQAASLSWMKRVLGSYAGPGEAVASTRETLRVFFATGQNYSRTAELTGLHRNTVRHRVARFESQHVESMAFDPLEVALALRIHETFGV